ncbi:STAS domain-containing protein [Streptomyces sp. NPDC102467]|uniref:STAS domain-containing protein n=1 Tax=Streptomyces sp. NPDC102467 TaxID=3366179 RepID=UPI0038256AAD
MPAYFVDELLLIAPLHHPVGVRLFGEVVGAHKGPLSRAVAEQTRATDEITVDLTRVHYLANSALETLVALAQTLHPPQRLHILACPELEVRQRLAAHAWDQAETLRLTS